MVAARTFSVRSRRVPGWVASCRGKAPLGILWRLGKKDLGVWYRNERRVGAAGRESTHDA